MQLVLQMQVTDSRNGWPLKSGSPSPWQGIETQLTRAGLCRDDNEEKGSLEARVGGVAQWGKALALKV